MLLQGKKYTLTHLQLIRHEQLALHGASSPGGAQFYPGEQIQNESPLHWRADTLFSVHPNHRYRGRQPCSQG